MPLRFPRKTLAQTGYFSGRTIGQSILLKLVRNQAGHVTHRSHMREATEKMPKRMQPICDVANFIGASLRAVKGTLILPEALANNDQGHETPPCATSGSEPADVGEVGRDQELEREDDKERAVDMEPQVNDPSNEDEAMDEGVKLAGVRRGSNPMDSSETLAITNGHERHRQLVEYLSQMRLGPVERHRA